MTVNGERDDNDPEYEILHVAVTDTGIGIRKEDIRLLFSEYVRIDLERNRYIEGTGLGISISRQLLQMMGSSLQVKSKYGRGSTFYFDLRQKITDEQPMGDFSREQEQQTATEYYSAGYEAPDARILVVDDNDMNRKVARSLMKRNGVVPDEASSGAEALDRLAAGKYDVVFLDHMMPKMDGIETLQQAREKGLLSEGCVMIALTANAVSGAGEKYLEAGFDDYLSKPIEVTQLEKKLAAWLPENKTEWRSAGGKKEAKETPEFAPNKEETSEDILEFAPDEEGSFGSAVVETAVCMTDGDTAAKEDLKERLLRIGLSVETALRFCGGDPAFYGELLTDYTESHAEKKQELDRSFADADWHEFEVKIHALKSTSKTIGAAALSEQALSLEKAAERGDAGYIREAYPAFAKAYEEVTQAIRQAMEQANVEGID